MFLTRYCSDRSLREIGTPLRAYQVNISLRIKLVNMSNNVMTMMMMVMMMTTMTIRMNQGDCNIDSRVNARL